MSLPLPICPAYNSTNSPEMYCPIRHSEAIPHATITTSSILTKSITSIVAATTKIRYILAAASCASRVIVQELKPRLSSITATALLGSAAFGLCGQAITAFGEGKRKKGLALLTGSVTSAVLCAINVHNFSDSTQLI